MRKVKITAIRKVEYPDLMEKYENKIEHTCSINEGDSFISIDAKCPYGFCESAWSSIEPFVTDLANGKNNFYDGWMQNVDSAMISCNDGFRPVSFYLEALCQECTCPKTECVRHNNCYECHKFHEDCNENRPAVFCERK